MLGFDGGSLLVFLLILGLTLIVLIISREIVCWYWKVNERLEEQKRTNRLLKKLLEKGEVNDNETIDV